MNMLRFVITNMNCGGCAKSVRAALGKVAPGAQVSVDLEHQQVTVAAAEAAEILAGLLADGWKATAIPG